MLAQLGLAIAGGVSRYKRGKADEKFKRRQIALANEEGRDRWNAKQEQYYAQVAADMARLQGQTAASGAMLNAQRDSFGLTRQAEEGEQDQRDKFAKAILDFGEANKKVNLADAKAKRSGRAGKASKGAKVSGTSGRAGRMSGAFRTGARQAIGQGLAKAATTTGMEAALSGYGADLDREFGDLGELRAQGAVVGSTSKRKRDLGRYREMLGSRERGYMLDAVNSQYAVDSVKARQLGILPPAQTFAGKPDYGIWDKVGTAAQIGATAYGMGAFNGQPQQPQGYGLSYGPGSNYPQRYTGAPRVKRNHPGGL